MNVLITGSTGSLGREFAKKLTEKHYSVFQHGTHEIQTEEVDSYLCCDFYKNPDWEACRQFIRKNKINLLINNAGVYDSSIEEVIAVNLLAPIKLTTYVAELAVENKNKAIIININSLAGLHPNKNEPYYCASKFGLKGYAEAMCLRLLGTGIQFCNVYLGAFQSEITKSRHNYECLMTPEKVAKSIVDLISHDSYLPSTIEIRNT